MADWNLNYAAFEQLASSRAVQADLDRRAEAARAAADAACPRSKDGRHGQPPGHLASTIRVERRGYGRAVLYGNDTTARYAWIIEWGSAAHEINRKHGGPMLHWIDETSAHQFRRRVWHPGTRPYFVMSRDALEAARNA